MGMQEEKAENLLKALEAKLGVMYPNTDRLYYQAWEQQAKFVWRNEQDNDDCYLGYSSYHETLPSMTD